MSRRVRSRTARHEHRDFSSWRGVIFQLFVWFYIGYFGAGAGVLILAMALLGMDEIHATILMAVASMIGEYFGAHFAQKTKPEHVCAIIIVIGFTLTAHFLAKQYQH